MSHKPGSRLPLLSARPAVTLTTLKSADTNLAVMLSSNRFRQTVHTHCASCVPHLEFTVHQPAAYCRVYDSRHLQADPRTGISSGTLRSVIEYGLPLLFYWGGIKNRPRSSVGRCIANLYVPVFVDCRGCMCAIQKSRFHRRPPSGFLGSFSSHAVQTS